MQHPGSGCDQDIATKPQTYHIERRDANRHLWRPGPSRMPVETLGALPLPYPFSRCLSLGRDCQRNLNGIGNYRLEYGNNACIAHTAAKMPTPLAASLPHQGPSLLPLLSPSQANESNGCRRAAGPYRSRPDVAISPSPDHRPTRRIVGLRSRGYLIPDCELNVCPCMHGLRRAGPTFHLRRLCSRRHRDSNGLGPPSSRHYCHCSSWPFCTGDGGGLLGHRTVGGTTACHRRISRYRWSPALPLMPGLLRDLAATLLLVGVHVVPEYRLRQRPPLQTVDGSQGPGYGLTAIILALGPGDNVMHQVTYAMPALWYTPRICVPVSAFHEAGDPLSFRAWARTHAYPQPYCETGVIGCGLDAAFSVAVRGPHDVEFDAGHLRRHQSVQGAVFQSRQDISRSGAPSIAAASGLCGWWHCRCI